MNPIKYIRTILCTKSIVDAATGGMSLIELVEGMTVQIKEPLLEGTPSNFPIGFDLVSFWKREKGEEDRKVDIKLDIIDPKGTMLNSFDASFDFPTDKLNMRFVLKVFGFAVTVAGTYLLRLSYKEQNETEHRLAEEIPYTVTFQGLLQN